MIEPWKERFNDHNETHNVPCEIAGCESNCEYLAFVKYQHPANGGTNMKIVVLCDTHGKLFSTGILLADIFIKNPLEEGCIVPVSPPALKLISIEKLERWKDILEPYKLMDGYKPKGGKGERPGTI